MGHTSGLSLIAVLGCHGDFPDLVSLQPALQWGVISGGQEEELRLIHEFKTQDTKPGVLAHPWNPSIWEPEVGG